MPKRPVTDLGFAAVARIAGIELDEVAASRSHVGGGIGPGEDTRGCGDEGQRSGDERLHAGALDNADERGAGQVDGVIGVVLPGDRLDALTGVLNSGS